MWRLVEYLLLAIALALFAFFEYLDMEGRLDILEKKHPKTWAFLNNRPARLLLIFLAVGFLAMDAKDAAEIPEPPLIKLAPPVISIPPSAAIPQIKEPQNSLRRRVMRLADDLDSLLLEQSKALPTQEQSRSMTPEQRDAANHAFDEVSKKTNLVYLEKFRPRTVGIIAELKAKGLLTDYWDGPMEKGAEFRLLQGAETHRLRELAYHLDAQDQVVRFYP
jgi:hypothetical protein